jgi:DedD protein
MAQSISDEELQLKKRARRRLVGAVALVTLVVIFLPMVLESEPKPVGQDIAIRIPSQDDGNSTTKSLPAAAKPAAPAPVQPVAAEPAAAQPATVVATASVAPATAAPAETIPENAAPAPAPPKTGQAVENSAKPQFLVLLGAFSSTANARQRQAKLAALGVKFYSETAKTPTGEKIRVRAGPYASRQEAEKVRDLLKGKGIQDGLVAEK